MAIWQAYLQRENELRQIDEQIVARPDDLEFRFQRAVVLNQLGRTDEARDAYLEILGDFPKHLNAICNLGALLMSTGYRTAAQTAFSEAVKHHPDSPVAQTHLANTLARNGDHRAAKRHFEQALLLAPDYPEAHQGLSQVLIELGDSESARSHRIAGFKNRSVMEVPYRGTQVPIIVLVLASSEGGAIPVLQHLDDKVFMTWVLIVDFYDQNNPIPMHHVAFNAMGDADICKASLIAAEKLLERSNVPVINHPTTVLETGCADNARRFAGLRGVVVPRTKAFLRETLAGIAAFRELPEHGFFFPLLLRSPGFHTGKDIVFVESPASLSSSIRKLPGTELMVIQFLSSRGLDGKYRKYRAMLIDGQILPIHVAISHDWRVHYFTADMQDDPAHRAEDEEFLTRMSDVIGATAMQTLQSIRDLLSLEYAGIDFGLNEQGELLLFEVNATMVVNPVDPDPRWDYRREPIARAIKAIRQLFVKRTRNIAS